MSLHLSKLSCRLIKKIHYAYSFAFLPLCVTGDAHFAEQVTLMCNGQMAESVLVLTGLPKWMRNALPSYHTDVLKRHNDMSTASGGALKLLLFDNFSQH